MWVRLGGELDHAGRFGNALSFDGAGARVTVADSASLDLTSAMTLEAWVFPTAGGACWRDVIYKGPDDIYFLESSSDRTSPAAGGTFGGPIFGTSALPLNVWSHLAATYDGATLRLFVGGVQVSSRAVFAPIADLDGGVDDRRGCALWAVLRRPDRRGACVRRALSASEIQADMTRRSAVPARRIRWRRRCRRGLRRRLSSATQINLAWTASTDNVGVTGYRVERCQGAGCSNFVQVGTPTGTSFSDTGLGGGDELQLSGAGGRSGRQPERLLERRERDHAGRRRIHSRRRCRRGFRRRLSSASQINLAWTASTDNVGVTGYRVERCQGRLARTSSRSATPTGDDASATPGLRPRRVQLPGAGGRSRPAT